MNFQLLLILGLPFIFSCSNAFRGQVVDELGNLVASHEGRINIVNLQIAREPGKMISMQKGLFEFNGELEPGIYLIEALIPGYETSSLKLQLPTKKLVKINTKSLAKAKVQPIGTYEYPQLSDGSGTVTLTPPKF